MTKRTIDYVVDGHVAIITLRRPEFGNAVDETMAAELRDACTAVIEDDAVYLAIVTGSGAAFSVTNPVAEQPATDEEFKRHRVAESLAAIPKPLIAAVNGDAIGHGLEIILACDIRIAAETARFALDQVQHGRIPWDGGTQRLPRAIPQGVALDMILTGKTLSAQEAREFGLVSEIVPAGDVLPKAKALAARLAKMAPIAANYAKEAAVKGMDLSLEQGLRLEADLAVILHSTADRTEGLKSFLEKRSPSFTGR